MLAAKERPRVDTALAIEAADFVTNLKERRAGVEHAVADHLATKARKFFKFLTWSDGEGSGEPETTAKAQLKLLLSAKKRPFGNTIHLSYVALVDSNPLATPVLPKHVVYKVSDDQPTHDPSQLEADLRRQIDSDFGNDSFRRKLEEQFLRFVPLNSEVMVDQEARSIILTVPWLQLRATTESELRVEFKAPKPGEPSAGQEAPPLSSMEAQRQEGPLLTEFNLPKKASSAADDGTLFLDPSGATADRRWPGATRCTISKLSFPPLKGPWDDRLPAVLQPENVRQIDVFMHHYILDPRAGFEDGIDTDLDDSGSST